MAERRTITIPSPAENILMVQIEAELVDRFVRTATDKQGPFRSKKESFGHALESAVAVALTKFLEGLEA